MTRELSPFAGVSRRDFLKYCSWLAALIGAGQAGVPDVVAALEKAAKRPSVVWSSFQACTGCAIHLLQAREPTVQDLILRQISLDYQDNVMAANGSAAEKVFADVTATKGGFFYVVEGSVPMKIPGALTQGGKTAAEILKETYPKAKGTIAIGTCATYGNIQAAHPNPTGAVGTAEALKQMGVANPVVINLSRCPGHGDDLIATLTYILVNGKLPALDAIGRPTFLYGKTIHDSCFRRGHFEAGEFVLSPGDPNTANDWCLYKIGCKGPVTFAPCGQNLWNGDVSWCVHNAPCQGCSEPAFWDNLTPFNEQVRGGDLPGVFGVSAEQIGIGLGIATAVGLGAHAIGTGIKRSREHGEVPSEENRG